MDSQRRIFLHSAARITALAAAGSVLSGSGARAATRLNGNGYPFALGVASGSPLPDAVVLWTRINKASSSEVHGRPQPRP